MQTRITASFKKVVCKVSSEEFEKAKIEEKSRVLTESALNNEEVCLVFCPRTQYSKQFNFYRLWTPTAEETLN